MAKVAGIVFADTKSPGDMARAINERLGTGHFEGHEAFSAWHTRRIIYLLENHGKTDKSIA